MGEEMGLTRLQQTLRSLCFQTEWQYAVFWKLKHRARMMLTWEDAYYDNHERPALSDESDHMSFNGALKNLHDPLGLAVAKMSYLVYSLGEGIVGQVAITGKHQWIFADKPASSFWSSSEFCDGWQTQFSAGIRTIAVVAVSPHGVIQLGSLNKVVQDMKLVTHIKNLFFSLQNSSSEFIPNPIDHTIQGTVCEKNAFEVVNERDKSAELLQPDSRIINVGEQKQLQMKLPNKKKFVDEKCGWRDMLVSSNYNDTPAPCSRPTENTNLDNYFTVPVDKSIMDYPFSPLDLMTSVVWDRVKFDRVTYLQNEELQLPASLGMELGKGLEQSFDVQTDVSCIDTVDSSLKFSACCELHEALGPAFKKEQARCAWSESESQTETHIQAQEGMFISQFTGECRSEQLLEAIVANACTGSRNFKREDSLCKAAESLLTTGNSPQTPNMIKHGGCVASGSITQSSLFVGDGINHHSNLTLESTVTCSLRSPNESSSKTLGTCNKQLEMQVEPAKTSRKRARSGESCRPRPRDRQLIQDRVKELRELVPNGSKCSIDSLLERTIKHMLFLQNVSNHADKLKGSAESTLRDKRRSLLGFRNREHGSSWAVEVGNQINGCPIVVENLNLNGQILVEMLCEDCNHFLQIAETIRRLGLSVLKGATEVYGEKTWACFVVEEQNNRRLHRMDILWSLMQLLQPTTSI